MPGRTPAEALRAFLDPLQSALSCVVRGKIIGATAAPNVTQTWTLTPLSGARLSNGRLLHASMRYRLIEDEGDRGPWRATTEGYLYRLCERDGTELVLWHWHPAGASPVTAPHSHFAAPVLAPDGIFTPKTHVDSPRITVEEVIRKCVDWGGAKPLCTDWRDKLAATETPHRLYRTWHVDPSERAIAGGGQSSVET